MALKYGNSTFHRQAATQYWHRQWAPNICFV